MKWKQIEQSYPKAFEKFVNWIDAESEDILQFELIMILKDKRDLYDFFDEQGIYINTDSNNLSDRITFSYIIPDYSTGQSKVEYDFRTRKSAEKAAYVKAFEILEKLCK